MNPFFYLGQIFTIFSICLLSYFNTLQVPFQFDGVVHIEQNHWIKDFPTFFNEFGITNFWNRSILVFTYTVNYYLGRGNTLGYHLFNLFLHFGVCNLIYLVARKILIHSQLAGMAMPPHRMNIPLISALLFAGHPVNTQAVTYLMSRSALLATLFYLGSFYCFMLAMEGKFLKPASGRGKIHIAGLVGLSLILMVLGYGSKLTIVTLPAMMLIYYFIFFKTQGENLFRFIRKEIRLLTLIALPFLIFIVYKAFFTNRGLFGIPDAGHLVYSKLYYFLTEIKMGVFYYLKVLFFPINLNVDPDISLIETFADPLLILSALVLASYIIFVKDQPKPAIFGFLWFTITLSPESSIIPLNDIIAEHRMYLPGIGFIIMVSALLPDRRWLPFYVALLIFLPINTINRNGDWFSEKTLWRDVVKKSPQKARSFINYARALHFAGELEPAAENYKQAIEIDSYYFEPHHNLAEIYLQVGKCKDAIKEFEYALLLVPELVESMVGLGKCYKKLGKYDKAIDYFRKSLKIRPSLDAALLELGLLHYFELNEREKGRFYIKQALRMNPNIPNREVLFNLIKK